MPLNGFGSLQNAMTANIPPATPKVGDGATLLHWTDRSPATVVWVSPSGKTIHLQEDDATRTDDNGMSECQNYTFTPNPAAVKLVARLTKKGWKVLKGAQVRIGNRSKYHDYSF
jgi:hypothetical protein